MDVASVFPQVAQVIAETLDMDPGQIHLEQSFMDDLGAESLDWAELLLTFEEQLGVVIPDGYLEGEAKRVLGEQPFEEEGVLTEAALQALRELMPELPTDRLQPGLKVRDLPRLYTVESFCRLALTLRPPGTT